MYSRGMYHSNYGHDLGVRDTMKTTKDMSVANAVVAFEEHGEAQAVMRLFEFREKTKTPAELGANCLVKIEASSVSMTDVLIRKNLWHQQVNLPCKTGCDLVGKVILVGVDCPDIQKGDRVCAIGVGIGGNAKYAFIHAKRLMPVPADVEGQVVVSLLRSYMTAYQCLYRVGGFRIRAGQKVLVTGGAGCLGQAVIQFALAAGASQVFATGRGSQSRKIITDMGARALGREPDEWLPSVQGEMDIVIDSVCSDGYASSRKALKPKGKLICVGTTAVLSRGNSWFGGQPVSTKLDIMKASGFMSQTSFYDVFSSFETKSELFRNDMLKLYHLARQGIIQPAIAYAVPLNELANAHEDLEAGGITGNIICLPWGPKGEVVQQRGDLDDDDMTTFSDGTRMRIRDTGSLASEYNNKLEFDSNKKEMSNQPPPPVKMLTTNNMLDDVSAFPEDMSEFGGPSGRMRGGFSIGPDDTDFLEPINPSTRSSSRLAQNGRSRSKMMTRQGSILRSNNSRFDDDGESVDSGSFISESPSPPRRHRAPPPPAYDDDVASLSESEVGSVYSSASQSEYSRDQRVSRRPAPRSAIREKPTKKGFFSQLSRRMTSSRTRSGGNPSSTGNRVAFHRSVSRGPTRERSRSRSVRRIGDRPRSRSRSTSRSRRPRPESSRQLSSNRSRSLSRDRRTSSSRGIPQSRSRSLSQSRRSSSINPTRSRSLSQSRRTSSRMPSSSNRGRPSSRNVSYGAPRPRSRSRSQSVSRRGSSVRHSSRGPGRPSSSLRGGMSSSRQVNHRQGSRSRAASISRTTSYDRLRGGSRGGYG